METIAEQDIQEIPISSPYFRAKVERFLEENGLRLEVLDYYYAVQSSDGSILAGAGLAGDVIKCVAVSSALRSEGLLGPLVSHVVSEAAARGVMNLKVFTKPSYQVVFESLGFKLLASAPQAVLMENGRGLEEYCNYLRQHKAPGVIIMNANPFTWGHKYLVNQALQQFATPWPYSKSGSEPGNLAIIPVREDVSLFSYEERREMILKGTDGDADVLEGSAYQISAATFPTYFLKDLNDASETQMRLDIDLFGRHIAPALGASIRFVGGEPDDPLTALYNKLLEELLPRYGVMLVQLPRKKVRGVPISATRVREALAAGRLSEAASVVPETTRPYLLAALAERALRLELDTPLKPGLVGPDGNGAHSDMNYDLMLRSIKALRPYWSKMAMAAGASELRALGIEAEKAMLAATGGVNTHRGAIFALGLALNAAWSALSAAHEARLRGEREMQSADIQSLIQNDIPQIAYILFDKSLTNSELHSTPKSHGQEASSKYGVKGAKEMALEGYKYLFEDWLPFYLSLEGEEFRIQKTLLKIMTTLEDTCVIHRVDYDRAQGVKAKAKTLLARGMEDEAQFHKDLTLLCKQYALEGVSPGGAADMLALTIFIDSITN
ncbi:MAG: triphosphoribosyl-dephospho-CoA synthase [Bacteroidales bacterium]|nr:triphosphoribosyl-dephospho-CoA synthase [Bacteroidales bacterium]